MKKIFSLIFVFSSISGISQQLYAPAIFDSLMRIEKYEEAIQFLKANPHTNNVDYYLDLGYAFFKSEKFADAFSAYEMANRISGTNTEAL